MTHANAYVEGIRADLQKQFPAIPDCVIVGDEPANDFGIAHTWGKDDNGCVHNTYDVGYAPSYHTVVHELGHALNANLAAQIGAWEDAQCVKDFWALRGFPVTIQQADAESAAMAARNYPFASWQRIPVEVFAEEFAAMVTQDGRCMTWNWGTARNDVTLRAFFASLRGGADVAFKDDPDAKAFVVAQTNTDEAIKKVLTELSNRQNELDLLLRQIIQKYPL